MSSSVQYIQYFESTVKAVNSAGTIQTKIVQLLTIMSDDRTRIRKRVQGVQLTIVSWCPILLVFIRL